MKVTDEDKILPIDEIKKHLYIEIALEDEILKIYRDGAISSIESHINRKIRPHDYDFSHTLEESDLILTPSLKVAILLYVGDLYNNRENSQNSREIAQLPLGVKYLIEPYKHFN